LSENLGGKIVFVPLQNLQLNYEMINFGWMNTRCLAVLDQVQKFTTNASSVTRI